MLLSSHYSEFFQCLSVQFIWRVEGGMFIVEDVRNMAGLGSRILEPYFGLWVY